MEDLWENIEVPALSSEACKAKKSRGRVKDLDRNNSVKSRRRIMDAQNFDTQRNLAADFAGTRENILMSRSTGIKVDDCASGMEKCSFDIFHRGWILQP
ncbi:hypothetical protein F2Q69_00011334 [Brassica cretica]|uniref:Uncharacterized protein n=1 Tax=Brassica cretica TaxID=69181 RepID=A0A8S9QNK0_BRACR|nr:hypothetical protein F2Q69_00011334 [Brassica cretica]